MKAIQYRRIGAEPELVEIPTPEPGPGEILLEVTAAGVCHSDAFIMGLPEEQYTFGLPLTLGHEGAGRVAAVGAGVKNSKSAKMCSSTGRGDADSAGTALRAWRTTARGPRN